MTGKIIPALTKIEADTHWSRGRLQEAMDIYTKLLGSSPNMTLNTRAAIESRIQLLRKELDRPEVEENGQVKMRARKRSVRLADVRQADLREDLVVVLEGLSGGERIAAIGAFKLRDGSLVAISEPNPAALDRVVGR